MTKKTTKPRVLWGVKRPDGTIIQAGPNRVKMDAVDGAAKKDRALLSAIVGGDDYWSGVVKRATNAGYAVVPVEVVEVES